MIRILVTLIIPFFLLTPSLAKTTEVDQKTAIKKLELEIKQILTEKHGYRGDGFKKLFFSEIEDDEYLKGIEKFKIALEKTKFVRDFKEIVYLYIDSRKTVNVSTYFGRREFYFPALESAEAFISLISEDPDNEPAYQQYLKDSVALGADAFKYKTEQEVAKLKNKVDRVADALKETYGSWYRYHEVGRDLLCETNYGSPDTSKIKKEVKRLLGKEVSSVDFHKIDLNRYDNYSKNIHIWFENSPESIEIETNINHAGLQNSYVRVDNKEKKLEFQSFFNSNCNFTKALIWEYDNKRKRVSKKIDSNGNIARTMYKSRDIRTLEEIYSNCTYCRPFSELVEFARNDERVLVTIYDTGVDYNHPEIAYKIHNMPIDASEKEDYRQKKARLNDEKRKIRDEFNKLTFGQQPQVLNEYMSKLKSIDRRLQESSIGWSFAEGNDKPYDHYRKLFTSGLHGTSVAGAASKGSDDIAILPIKVSLFHLESYEAMEMAHKKGSRIVNISLADSFKYQWKGLSDAIADHPDMLFIPAAGNDEENLDEEPFYPASFDYPNMLVVASVYRNNELSDFSNYSKTKVDIAAHGEQVLLPAAGNTYDVLSGTSLAAPQVTRTAAKVKFIYSSFNPEDIINIIMDSGTPVKSLEEKVKCGCVLNERNAIQMAGEMAIKRIRKSALTEEEKTEATKEVEGKVKKLLKEL